MKAYNYLIFFVLFALFPYISYGEEFSVTTENNIISELRPGQKVTAGFIDITVSKDAKIIKIEAEMIGFIEAHSMIMDGEIMKMRKISPVLVKNKKYKFKPGGNHLMLFDVARELNAGGDINLLFTFQLKNKKIFKKSIKFKIK
ncbi:copper chaperone PCu(A)C [Methylophilaceae bacterium]|jgi:copper(I)-binding protein|nr:copper chaperone PCu(A)C [Methylophilaceae bacterium]|tara:strand:+ start:5630 stop:6061 length:432 start_codon:yes stop_codon:yes gene_type:complete